MRTALSAPAAALLVAVAVAVAVAGCGEKRESGTGASTSTTASTTPAGPAAGSVGISETEFKLDPASAKVSDAGVVEFDVKNDGKTEHALEVEGPNGETETEPIAPGESAKLKADLSKPGTYEMYCPIGDHKEQGMKGEVVVAGGSDAGKGGSTTPEDSGGGGNGY